MRALGSPPRPRDDLAEAARALVLDKATVDAVSALSREGIDTVLLKGPAIATWLYPLGQRPYTDIDLLVSPGHRDRAIAVLRDLGYVHLLEGADPSEYGGFEVELVRADGVCIDLHHSLIGVNVSPQRCWDVLAQRTVSLGVCDRLVRVFDVPARTLHLALHVAQNGATDTKARQDLERGLAALPTCIWEEALVLATLLNARDAFAGGLYATPAAQPLIDLLRLGPPREVDVLLRIAAVPQEALQLQRLALASMPERLNLVARKVWPTRVFMHTRFPETRRSEAALVQARLDRLVRLPARFVPAMLHWRRARHVADRAGQSSPRVSGRTYP